MDIAFIIYKQHIYNSFQKLLKEKNSSKNISIRTTLILDSTGIYIGPTKFLNADISEMVFSKSQFNYY